MLLITILSVPYTYYKKTIWHIQCSSTIKGRLVTSSILHSTVPNADISICACVELYLQALKRTTIYSTNFDFSSPELPWGYFMVILKVSLESGVVTSGALDLFVFMVMLNVNLESGVVSSGILDSSVSGDTLDSNATFDILDSSS